MVTWLIISMVGKKGEKNSYNIIFIVIIPEKTRFTFIVRWRTLVAIAVAISKRSKGGSQMMWLQEGHEVWGG